MNEKLVVFLYVLMRDHLPTRVVESIIRDHVGKGGGALPASYSAAHLERYARELARKLS